jgi:tRNA1(Val) A37 N6-methylase TrmN6
MPVRLVTKANPRVILSDSITETPFYGGKLRLRQPSAGYRAAIDPVLLAASLAPRAGSVLIDLGCGVGAASLCLLARRPDVSVIGVEIDPLLTALARQNAALNGMSDRFTVIEGAVEAVTPEALPPITALFSNPPFHDPAATPSPDGRRARATHGAILNDWVALAARLLSHRGTLSLIYRADGLAAILAALTGENRPGPRFGGITVAPLWPRVGTAAKRVLVQASLGSQAPLTLQSGLVLHGAGSAYTAQTEAILRGEAAWEISPSASVSAITS